MREIRMWTRRGLTILPLFRSFIFSPSPPAYVYKKYFWEGEIIAVVQKMRSNSRNEDGRKKKKGQCILLLLWITL